MKKLLSIALLALALIPQAAMSASPVPVSCPVADEYLITFATPDWAVSGTVKNNVALNQLSGTSVVDLDYVPLTDKAIGIVPYHGTGTVDLNASTCMIDGEFETGGYIVSYRTKLGRAGVGTLVGLVETRLSKIGVLGRLEKFK